MVDESDRKEIEDQAARSILKTLLHVFRTAKPSIYPKDEGKGCLAATIVILRIHRPDQALINYVAEELLEIFNKNRTRFMGNTEALWGALTVAGLGASPEIMERIVHTALKKGWLWLCEKDMPAEKFLKRKLNAEEINFLVEHYVNDRACQSNDTEEKLAELAKKYMPADKFREVSQRLAGFRAEYCRWGD